MNNSIFTQVNSNIRFSDSVAKKNKGRVLPLTGIQKRTFVNDTQTFDANFTFLQTKLAKLHQKTYEPKTFFTYAQDVPIETGGGFVDYIEYYTVNWAGIMNDTRNVVGNGANILPRVNAGMTQNIAKVFTYEIAYDMKFVELEKLKKAQLSKSLEQIYQDGIRAGWDYFCQNIAYLGVSGVGGLFTSPKVHVSTISNPATTGHGFDGYNDDVVVAFINGIFLDSLDESNMNINLLPDTILVPTWFLADVCGRFSALYSASLFDFLKEHNLAKAQGGEGFKLTLVGRPDLNALGTAGKGRVVAYRKEKDYVRMDMPFPIQHYVTLPNVNQAAYTSIFVGQVSEVQMPYNEDANGAGVVKYYDFTN